MAISSKSEKDCFRIVSSARGKSDPPLRTESTTLTVGAWLVIACIAMTVQNHGLGDRNDKPPRPVLKLIDLRHDFVPQVPRQNEDVVRPSLLYFLGSQDRDSCSRQKMTLFVHVAVDRIFNEVPPDSTIVQQGVAFCRSTIGRNRFSAFHEPDQQTKQRSLHMADALSKRLISRNLIESGRDLLPSQLR